MGYNLHDVLRKFVAYYKRNHNNVKNDSWLWFEIIVIWKKKKTLNLHAINTLSKIHIYSKIIHKKMSYVGTTISIYYNKLPKTLFQNSFIGKNYFQAKGHVIHL